jgi:hypothetical protein
VYACIRAVYNFETIYVPFLSIPSSSEGRERKREKEKRKGKKRSGKEGKGRGGREET